LTKFREHQLAPFFFLPMKALIKHLESFITYDRLVLFNNILKERTRYVTVLLEDIYQPHNASAVLRSCDCFGVQDVHIVENQNNYNINPDVTLGSQKWLSLFKYNANQNNTLTAINKLKAEGYKIIATIPDKSSTPLTHFSLSDSKTAILFGNELRGLSQDAMAMADENLHIPMYGFTESLNISVSAAIILQSLTHQLRATPNLKWQLEQHEQQEIMLAWLKRTIKKSDLIVEQFNKKIS